MAAPWMSKTELSDAIKNDSDFTSRCQEISADVKCQKIKLLTLVEHLGGALTDLNPDVRERGTRILANVLKNLPEDFLVESELHFIVSFFCDRLNDHHSVVPAVLQGIIAIAGMKNISNSDACRVLLTVLRQVQCQTQTQPDRHTLYQIIQVIMYRATKELQDLGPDFVFGVLSAMDGERDPRNLMLLFNMLPSFLKLFPPGHLAEDMFEVVACYFPVDFHSPTSDPHAVSRDDLAVALSPCLTARPEFAVYCLPLLLEKLDSSLRVAKMDSLITMKSGIQTFTVVHLEDHLIDIWGQLKSEVLPGADNEVRELGLAALQALISKLSMEHSQKLNYLLDNIMAAGRDALRHADLSWFSPAVRLLATTAHASPQGCLYVLDQALPLLVAQCDQDLSYEKKALVLNAITCALSASVRHKVTPSTPETLLKTYLTAGDEILLRIEKLKGIAVLIHALDMESRITLYQLLCEWVHTEHDVSVREELEHCLKAMASYHPDEVMEHLIYTRLKLEHVCIHELDDTSLAWRIDILCTLATMESFTAAVAPQVLDLITQSNTSGRCSAGLKGLRKLVTLGSVNVHTFLHSSCNCILRLLSWWIQGVQDGDNLQIFNNASLLEDTSQILYYNLRGMESSVQDDVVAKVLPRYFESQSDSFQLLKVTSPTAHTRCVLLLEGIIGAVKSNVEVQPLIELCQQLIHLLKNSTDSVTQKSAARLLALVVNKTPHLQLIDNLLQDIKKDSSCPPLLVTWLSKALLLRGHPAANEWLTALITHLSSADTGSAAAEGFLTLLDTEQDHLNTASYCNVRILYKQRLFQSALSLSTQARTVPKTIVQNYHTALAYLLKGVPQEVLTSDIPQTVSLLLECLQVNHVSLLEATLETLSTLARNSQPELADHLTTLVHRCLILSQSHSSMKVRIAALECLLYFGTYSTILLLPLKQDVVHGTAKCVDDQKRLVRRAAVTARTRWFLVGAPGEPVKR